MQTRLLVVILFVAVCSGCVRRRMTIRSNPPGALVFVDEQEIGKTPVSTSFVYYGTRKIRLVRDGYETLTVMHDFSRPWYQYPGIDFFAENLYPREVRDERILEFDLEPQQLVPRHELVERGDQMRSAANPQPYRDIPPEF